MPTIFGRQGWLDRLEGHWKHFADAGVVEKTALYAYTPATEAAAESVATTSTVKGIDSVWFDDQDEQRSTGDGGFVLVRRKSVKLRQSHLKGYEVTSRAVLRREVDDTYWAVTDDPPPRVVCDGNEVVCRCHEIPAGAMS